MAGKAGIALTGMILVGAATILQMFVDWHQQSVSQSVDPKVKLAILGAGFLSLLAVLIGLLAAGGGRR